MELLLVRHALPLRVERPDGTPADPPLSDLGRRQADSLADALADEPIAAVYTSPLRRARETADAVAHRFELHPAVDDDLAEFDRDASAYVPMEELRAAGDPIWHAMVDGSYWDAIDLPAFRRAAVAAVDRIVAARAGDVVVVVTHGGIINVYAAHILGVEKTPFFDPAYASVSRVLADRSGRRSVKSLNEATHVRGLLPP